MSLWNALVAAPGSTHEPSGLRQKKYFFFICPPLLLIENKAEIISGFTFQTKIRITFLLGASWVGGWLRQECHIFLMSSNSHSLVIVFNGTIAEVPYFLQLLKFTMPHHQQHIYFLVWASRKCDHISVLHFFHFPWEKVRPSPMAHFDHPVG